jgi:hypothetical protein
MSESKTSPGGDDVCMHPPVMKRARRNAIKPNSQEAKMVMEVGIQHVLEGLDINVAPNSENNDADDDCKQSRDDSRSTNTNVNDENEFKHTNNSSNRNLRQPFYEDDCKGIPESSSNNRNHNGSSSHNHRARFHHEDSDNDSGFDNIMPMANIPAPPGR